MANMEEILLISFLLALGFCDAQVCPSPERLTFQKFVGIRPYGEPTFVYIASEDDSSLPETCLTRCKEMEACSGVSISYKDKECTGYEVTNGTIRMDYDVDYFGKICLEVQADCTSKWWTVESYPGYQLHPEGRNVKLVVNTTAVECVQALTKLSNENITYRSAQWTAKGKGSVMNTDSMSMQDSSAGSCILNIEDKYTEPESYRVANYLTLYMENQCVHDFPTKIERCSYEEYFNQTLKHVEMVLDRTPKGQCKYACEQETRFVCRGFTTYRSKNDYQCYLHSSDLLTHGSWILESRIGATYYRRVTCLNITVECGNKNMKITYYPKGVFRGRMYVTGKDATCSAGPKREGKVVLDLALNGACDINYAYAVNTGPDRNKNRTMAYVMLVIQNNPIIQTQGDRWIRAGCSLPPDEISLNASLAVNVQTSRPSSLNSSTAYVTQTEVKPPQAVGNTPSSAILNTSISNPPLLMYITYDGSGESVSLGEPLELRIETPVPPDVNEIQAYHLVASSLLGDSSVLLIDGKGCPTGQVDFPGFARTYQNGTQRLSARFKAFRFPNSVVVRFAVMVKFCHKNCRKIVCDGLNDIKNRTARETDVPSDNNLDMEQSGKLQDDAAWISEPRVGRERAIQLCGAAAEKEGRVLELSLVVGSGDVLTADRLLRAEREDGIETLDTLPGHAVVCIHELLLIAAVVAWLFIQILLIVGCLVVVKRYRDFAKTMNHKDYQHFDNVGFESFSTGTTHRRVHWPDQNVDIIHVN